jgi:hypothetical protein
MIGRAILVAPALIGVIRRRREQPLQAGKQMRNPLPIADRTTMQLPDGKHPDGLE